ncbi:hypothetical protein [Mycobacterium leprae]|nr:hypothetical protein [Mycobacterium leprae]
MQHNFSTRCGHRNRLPKYIGPYLAMLGHTDAVSFTVGIDENNPTVRSDALLSIAGLDIMLD